NIFSETRADRCIHRSRRSPYQNGRKLSRSLDFMARASAWSERTYFGASNSHPDGNFRDAARRYRTNSDRSLSGESKRPLLRVTSSDRGQVRNEFELFPLLRSAEEWRDP